MTSCIAVHFVAARDVARISLLCAIFVLQGRISHAQDTEPLSAEGPLSVEVSAERHLRERVVGQLIDLNIAIDVVDRPTAQLTDLHTGSAQICIFVRQRDDALEAGLIDRRSNRRLVTRSPVIERSQLAGVSTAAVEMVALQARQWVRELLRGGSVGVAPAPVAELPNKQAPGHSEEPHSPRTSKTSCRARSSPRWRKTKMTLGPSELDLAIDLPLDDGEGPARALDPSQAEQLANTIVDAWLSEVTPQAEQSLQSNASVGGKLSRISNGWAAAAGLALGFVLAGSMAAAFFQLLRSDTPDADDTPQVPAHRQAVEAEAERTETDTERTETGTERTVTDTERTVTDTERTARKPRAARRTARVTPPATEHSPATEQESLDLLARANERRRQGQFADAAALYERASSAHGVGGYAASVSAGELELEHLHRPARALRFFARAEQISPRGSLDLSVQLGRAKAARQLGRTAVELRALRNIVERYSEQPAAKEASMRLAALAAEDTP